MANRQHALFHGHQCIYKLTFYFYFVFVLSHRSKKMRIWASYIRGGGIPIDENMIMFEKRSAELENDQREGETTQLHPELTSLDDSWCGNNRRNNSLSGGYESQNKKNNNSYVGEIITLILEVASIYALVVTHDETVMDACGHELWNVLLARIICGSVIFILLFCFFGGMMVVVSGNNNITNGGGVGGLRIVVGAGCFVWFAITLVFTVLEALYASRAMESSSCMAALDNIKGRILPILVYVYMGMDCLLLLFLLSSFCIIACGDMLAANDSNDSSSSSNGSGSYYSTGNYRLRR